MNSGVINGIIQGTIQGLTEFLPVSSSGHLTLFQHFTNQTNLEANMSMDISVHLGTLFAVAFYFRNDLIPFFKPSNWKNEKIRKTALLIIAATIPTGLIGIGFKKQFEALFASPVLVCVALFLTGLILLISEKRKNSADQTKEISDLSLKNAVAIGIAQGFAITPGISRSGSTISAGLLSKLTGEDAAKFSFLLMIPAVSGATLLEVRKILKAGLPDGVDWASLTSGFSASLIVGFLALNLLVYIIKKQKLSLFSYYLFAVSIVCGTLILFPGIM